MKAILTLVASLGLLGSLYWGARFLELSGSPNGGLAAFALVQPLGFSLLVTAVCACGAAVLHQLELVTGHLAMIRDATRRQADLAIASSPAAGPAAAGPEAGGHWVNPKHAPARTSPPYPVLDENFRGTPPPGENPNRMEPRF